MAYSGIQYWTLKRSIVFPLKEYRAYNYWISHLLSNCLAIFHDSIPKGMSSLPILIALIYSRADSMADRFLSISIVPSAAEWVPKKYGRNHLKQPSDGSEDTNLWQQYSILTVWLLHPAGW